MFDFWEFIYTDKGMITIAVIYIIWCVFATQKTFITLYWIKWIVFAASFIFLMALPHFTGDSYRTMFEIFAFIWFPLYFKPFILFFLVFFGLRHTLNKR